MSAVRPTSGVQFLTIPEGAAHLGVSGLRLREAALRGTVPSQRDNQGQLRVDLTGLRALPELPKGAAPLAADDVLGLLFDEVEDLQDALGSKVQEVARLSDLVERQGQAIEKADKALSTANTAETVESARKEAELTGLLDRALTVADGLQAEADQVAQAQRAELQVAQNQLARALALSERAVETAANAGAAPVMKPKGISGLLARIFGR